MLHIGKSVLIKGELTVEEDVLIEGLVEGTIHLHNHVLTVGPIGRIDAQVFARSVIVLGKATGTITATDKIDIRDNASLDGDVVSPRLQIAEGACFNGFVEMPRSRRPAIGSPDAAGTPARFAPETIAVKAHQPPIN